MTMSPRLRWSLRVMVGAVLLCGLLACTSTTVTRRTDSASSPGASAPTSASASMPGVSAHAAPLQLKRVVMLIRHGVRPPTKPVVMPPGWAADPWPQWSVPFGHLTEHGYQGAVLVGAFDRATFAAAGLFADEGCPVSGSVVVWADTDERTRRTGDAFSAGFAPHCDIVTGYADGHRNDPLFAAVENGAVPYDPLQAQAAIMARVDGDLANAMVPLQPAFARLGAILRCCSPKLCSASGLPAGCMIGALGHVWEEPRARKRVKFIGPLSLGGTAAQAILLQYVEGKPMADVGWGRASVADLALMSKIHAVEFDLLARTPYIANRASTPTMQRVLQEFSDANAPRLTVLVGHDTNVANVGGMLDVHWHVPGYAEDDPAVNGALGFELLDNARGQRFVRVFFQAQGTQQLRNLQVLDASHKPYFAYLPQPVCGLPKDRTLCTLAGFEKAVRARLVLPQQAWNR